MIIDTCDKCGNFCVLEYKKIETVDRVIFEGFYCNHCIFGLSEATLESWIGVKKDE